MKNSLFTIYVDRLANEQEAIIEETLDGTWVELNEPEIVFPSPLKIKLKGYLAKPHLILDVHIDTEVSLPCTICNDPVTLPIKIKENSHTIPLSKVRSALFDASGIIREILLLKIPDYAECKDNCPERETLSQYLKN